MEIHEWADRKLRSKKHAPVDFKVRDESPWLKGAVEKIMNTVPCPHCQGPINPAALLRSIESEARKETSRKNGAKGGRPQKKKGTK